MYSVQECFLTLNVIFQAIAFHIVYSIWNWQVIYLSCQEMPVVEFST